MFLNIVRSERLLRINYSELMNITRKLSSGLKIERAADDPSGLAISQKLRSQIMGGWMALKNAQDALAMVNTMDAVVGKVIDIVQRIRELYVEGLNDALSDSDKDKINLEISQLISEIDQVSGKVRYNVLPLINITDVLSPTRIETTPSDVVFVVDFSGSMRTEWPHVKASIENFLDFVESEGYSVRVGFVAFGGVVGGTRILDLTGDFNAVRTFMDSLPTPYGNIENTYDALIEASSLSWSVENKNIILFTDDPPDDIALKDSAINTLLSEGIEVYGIVTGSDALAPVREISDATGGTTVLVGSQDETAMSGAITSSGAQGEKVEVSVVSGLLNVGTLNIQVGPNEGDVFRIWRQSVASDVIGIKGLSLDFGFEGLSIIDDAIDYLSSFRAKLGSYQKRLEAIVSKTQISIYNMTRSISRLEDGDMAELTLEFVKSVMKLSTATRALGVYLDLDRMYVEALLS